MRLYLSSYIIITLLFIPISFAIGSILNFNPSQDTVIMPGSKQSIILEFEKPIFSNPQDIKIDLELKGMAFFENHQKKYSISIDEINWSDTALKKYTITLPLILQNTPGENMQTITAKSEMTYYNTLFGYRKTTRSNESHELSFSVIWTMQDEVVHNDFNLLKKEHEALKQQYSTLQQNYANISNENGQLKTKNKELLAENKQADLKNTFYHIYKWSSIILLSIMIIYLTVHLIKNRR